MTDLNRYYQIAELLAAYVASEDKVMPVELQAWLEESVENRATFERLTAKEHVKASLSRYVAVDVDKGWETVSDQLFAKPLNTVAPLWKYIGVAAAIAVMTLGVWLYTNEIGSSRKASRNDEVVMNDIAPGKNTATLTLPGGKVIKLSDAKTGVVIDNDQLAYDDGSALRHPELVSGSRTREAIMLTASTPRGGTYQVILPDGSKVWLNADSKITFPSQFNGKERRIQLTGEAYFEIASLSRPSLRGGTSETSSAQAKQPTERIPFIVESKGQQVKVLGTHFNINAYADEPVVKTTLLEGSVAVSHAASGKEVILKPNQQSILKNINIAVAEVNAEDAVSWKSGYFVFKATTLEAVMKQVERWYNVEVVYKNEALKNRTFSGSASRYENVSIILKTIENTGEVKFKIEGRRVIVQE